MVALVFKSINEGKMLCSLEVWPLGGLKRRLPWNFACADFIKNLVPSKAFTMAEILISLTIIGIIAAITLPALQANINESAWKAQRKALYSRMSQAISMMPSLNGYGTYSGEWESDSVTVSADTAAQAFVTDGLSKVLQLKNICSVPMSATSEAARVELKKCGLPDKIKSIDNMNIEFPTKLSELNNGFTTTLIENENPRLNPQSHIDTRVAGLETVNGESVAVFYNPSCVYKDVVFATGGRFYPYPYMCANFVYDLNGRKGPNKMGKDVGFMTALYPVDSEVVAPMPSITLSSYPTWSQAISRCNTLKKGSRLPNYDEAFSILINKTLIGGNVYTGYSWTSVPYDDENAWLYSWSANFHFKYSKSTQASGNSMCILR